MARLVARYVRDATLPVELAPADDGTDAPASNAEPTPPADDSHTTTRPAHALPQELTDDAVHQVIEVGQQAGDPLQPAMAGWSRAGDRALLEWAIQSGGDFMHAVACELGAGCVTPRGPPDALCEVLPRCARKRWDSAAIGVDPASPMASAVNEIRRTLAALQR